jgi:hypothetical protein
MEVRNCEHVTYVVSDSILIINVGHQAENASFCGRKSLESHLGDAGKRGMTMRIM